MRDRRLAAPGSPFDRQTRRSLRDLEQRGAARIGRASANAVFGPRPRRTRQQPGTRSDFCAILVGRFRRSREIDQTLLDAERLFPGPMTARECF